MNLSADHLAAAIAETAAVVRAGWAERPRAAIILGTGLGSLAEHITIEAEWSYRDLPHFARSTADGHRGRLLAGRLADVPILAMDGRFHAYEGYSFSQITFPVRIFAELGASFLIVSNASGGLNPTLRSGDILLIDDHINLMGIASSRPIESRKPMADGRQFRTSPESSDVVGQVFNLPANSEGSSQFERHSKSKQFFAGQVENLPHENEFACLRTSCQHQRVSFYDDTLCLLAQQIAADEEIALRRGTYIAMLGPNYETRAEYRWLRSLGDVVGMSTVPEVTVAREVGLPIVAFSMVTNVFRPDVEQQTTSEQVVAAASNSEPNLRRIVTRLLERSSNAPISSRSSAGASPFHAAAAQSPIGSEPLFREKQKPGPPCG